jgi:hypothetical protein
VSVPLVPDRHRTAVAAGSFAGAGVPFGVFQCIYFGERLAGLWLDLTPNVLYLRITRASGPQLAGVLATLAAVVAVDAAARSGASEAARGMGPRRVLLLAAMAPFAYLPATVLQVVGALAAWRYWFEQDARSFIAPFRNGFLLEDLLAGFVRTVVYAIVLVGLLLAGRRLWESTAHSLRLKLWVAAATLVVTHLGELLLRVDSG